MSLVSSQPDRFFPREPCRTSGTSRSPRTPSGRARSAWRRRRTHARARVLREGCEGERAFHHRTVERAWRVKIDGGRAAERRSDQDQGTNTLTMPRHCFSVTEKDGAGNKPDDASTVVAIYLSLRISLRMYVYTRKYGRSLPFLDALLQDRPFTWILVPNATKRIHTHKRPISKKLRQVRTTHFIARIKFDAVACPEEDAEEAVYSNALRLREPTWLMTHAPLRTASPPRGHPST